MNRLLLLPSAYVLDQVAGDPEWLPHPVRLIGLAISHGETLLRRKHQDSNTELVAGAALTLAVVASTFYLSRETIRLSRIASPLLADAIELLLAWTCLAARNLQQEATSVTDALAFDDMPLARRRLARIVGRDTAHLDIHEISRAVIETLAESAADGILAPMFYLALGRVPLALAYKAINTLDSMIGHADDRYLYFGKAAARLDDIANLLPARATALAIVAASCLAPETSATQAWKIWHRDGHKHKSPNAGQPESAMAGALGVRLGGLNTYAGDPTPTHLLGHEFPAPNLSHARQAVRLVSAITLIGLAASMPQSDI